MRVNIRPSGVVTVPSPVFLINEMRTVLCARILGNKSQKHSVQRNYLKTPRKRGFTLRTGAAADCGDRTAGA